MLKTKSIFFATVVATPFLVNAGFQDGAYVGGAMGGSKADGKRTDTFVSSVPVTYPLSNNKSISDSAEQGEIFLGYFYPFMQDQAAFSVEGTYGFSSFSDKVSKDTGILPAPLTDYVNETIEAKRFFGASARIGAILQNDHFLGIILGGQWARFKHSHSQPAGNDFLSSSKTLAGFQYGLSYQYGWDHSTIGIELKQTRFPSKTFKETTASGAFGTTKFKLNINSLMLRYTYRF